MDCKVNWTDKAWDNYEAIIKYLQTDWTQTEVRNFALATDRKIERLKKYPKIGNPKNKKQYNIRHTIIIKRIVVLVYKHKPLKNEIDLLLFWNTRKHPRKLKVK
jgi:plasmid stabilization system protein ParE